jgi:HlyD family secretion protein
MKRRWKIISVCAIAVVAGVALFVVLRSRQNGVAYATQAVSRGAVAASVSANGTLNPVILVNVGTQVSGTVKALRADFNDRVRAGQVLAELDPALLRAQLRESEAALAGARANLDLAIANERRARPMHEQGYLTAEQYDQALEAVHTARAQVEQASAQVAHDRTNVNYAVIRSPVAGVVVNRAVDIGQTVAASFQTPTLFQIAQDLKQMQIDSNFAEADIGRIRPGQSVRFTVDAFPERSFSATVRQVRLNPTTVQNVVTYDVVVAVANPDEILMPGMTAYVSVIFDERNDALLVPNAALRFVPDGAAVVGTTPGEATVYVPDAGGARAIKLRTGISDGRNTEVLAGDLKPGDRVIVGKAQKPGRTSAPAAPSGGTMRLRTF